MKIKHEKSLLLPEANGSTNSRIECCAWSPDNLRLAICTSSNNQIILYNAVTCERKEKFALKPVEKNSDRQSFIVKGIAFSPDSSKLAVGQSDCVIFIYKIGTEWGDKKSIVGKFSLQSPCSSLLWHDKGIIFGSLDGKVRMVQTTTNRIQNIASSETMITAICCCIDEVVIGTLDGSIIISNVGSREASRVIAKNTSGSYAISITSTGYVFYGNADGRLNISSITRSKQQTLEFGDEILFVASSPAGNVTILSYLDKLVVLELDGDNWKQSQVVQLEGSFLIFSIFWSNDGTKVIAGTLNGAVELFTFEWKKKKIGGRYDVNFVGTNQITISGDGISASYSSVCDIKDIKIVKEFFIVIWTVNSLIVGDVRDPETCSEVNWSGITRTGVKFSFDYQNVVLINVVGELYLVELGSNEFLSSVRTDFVSPLLLSVRINERKSDSKTLAYLLDIKTICIMDLISSSQLCSWSHEQKIDWLELSETGDKLLFRDRSFRLHLLDVSTQEIRVMLNFCGFVQWVPGSDVIVAQVREKLYVWYDLNKPVIHEIEGGSRIEATGIEREGGLTRVTFTGGSKNDIILDETFLEFDTSLQDGDLERAMTFLESCDSTTDCESMWSTLAKAALQKYNMAIAEVAFAAIGDVSKAAFVRECADDHSKLALLEHDWATFEANDFDEAIETYIKLNKWKRAINLAERSGRLDLKDDLEKRYFNWLIETGQKAEAGALKEAAGLPEEAIDLYLQSGRLVPAAKVILESRKGNRFPRSLIESVISELKSAEFYEEAGNLYELPQISEYRDALDCYTRGCNFVKAIQLARREFPDEVVKLEEKFGEYLMNEARDPGSAISHLIEAGKTEKALEAAIQARQFDRAAEISTILSKIPPHFGKQIGDYYASRNDLDSAIDMYLNCGAMTEALDLLNSKGQFNRAYKLARKIMSEDEAREMFVTIASRLQQEKKYKDAERIFITCDDTDSAITMYKNNKDYDNMIRLVKQYHPDLLIDTHLHLAKELEMSGQLQQAEHHYIAVSEWKAAIQMYKDANEWEDAYRIARTQGGPIVAKQVAFLWAKSLPSPDAAVKLLSRFGLLHQIVDYSVECASFDFAHQLVQAAGPDLKHKAIEVKLKEAIFLEDEGRLDVAENIFIEAGKAKEAVIMYLKAASFTEALRVAEDHIKDENVVSEILVSQAKYMIEKGGKSPENLERVESLLLRAGRIELVIKMYRENQMWDDALRICEQYSPNMIDAIKREMMGSRGSSFSTSSRGRLASRASNLFDPTDDFEDGGDLRNRLERAEQSGDRETVVKTSLSLAAQLVREKAPIAALRILTSHSGVFIVNDTRRLMMKIAEDILNLEAEQPDPGLDTFTSLRDGLHEVLNNPGPEVEVVKVEKLLLVSHYLIMKTCIGNLSSQPAKDIELKVTVALLRYTDIVRVEKAFYEAGLVAKENGKLEMAFVFWNHFLDLMEAIEEGDTNVDHSELSNTDIPSEVHLPSRSFFTDPSLVEEVKSWILETSMDKSVSHTLPSCPFRESDVYEASLYNQDSPSTLFPCIITGYPVIKHKTLDLMPGKYAANKDDWNKFLMLTKTSGSEDLKEILHFIGRLCGNTSVMKFSFQ